MAPVTSDAIDSTVSAVGQQVSIVATFALAIIAIVYVVLVCKREQAIWPAILLASGTLTCILEPMFDHLYGLWFPTIGQWTLFTAYGISEPIWLVPAYLAIYGGGAVMATLSLRKRPTVKQVWKLYWALVAVAMVAEIAYITFMGVYEYQKNQPWVVLGYPLFLGFVNSMSVLTTAIIAYRIIPLLSGVSQFYLLALTPIGFAMEAFGSGAIYLAIRHGSAEPSMLLLHIAALTVPLGTFASIKVMTLLIPNQNGVAA